MNAKAVLISVVSACLLACDTGEMSAPDPPPVNPELRAGQAIVDANCLVCHGQGINGAPIIGNRKMWMPRLAQGQDVLVRHAIEGYNYDMMPPRGGNPNLSDDDIRRAVAYFVSQVAGN